VSIDSQKPDIDFFSVTTLKNSVLPQVTGQSQRLEANTEGSLACRVGRSGGIDLDLGNHLKRPAGRCTDINGHI